ncbi:hypothetical protein ACLOJK_033551 [Asimina triloba]
MYKMIQETQERQCAVPAARGEIILAPISCVPFVDYMNCPDGIVKKFLPSMTQKHVSKVQSPDATDATDTETYGSRACDQTHVTRALLLINEGAVAKLIVIGAALKSFISQHPPPPTGEEKRWTSLEEKEAWK